MNQIKLLLPKTLVNFNKETDIVFFLAGPIKGADDWQKEAITILQKFAHTVSIKKNVYVVCPADYQPTHELYPLKVKGISEENYSDEQREITSSRTSWERPNLEIASRLGCIIFWLAKEDKENPRKKEDGPYARDTYGELGEWRARIFYEQKNNRNKINLVIGADPAFNGLAQIKKNFDRMIGEDFLISNSLKETIKRAVMIQNK